MPQVNASGQRASNAAGVHAAKPFSLRARLTWALLAVVAVAACLQAFSIYRTARAETEALFDGQMQRIALALSAGLASEVASDALADPQAKAQDMIVQIWRADGIMLYRSSNARLLPQVAVLGFSDARAHGTAFRIYALQTPTQVIQVAQEIASRRQMAGDVALRSIVPVLLLAPLIMLVVWWVVTRTLAPLQRTRSQLAARRADDLSPLPDADLPLEVQPLVQEMNLLLARLQAAFDALQRFVGDAAHELRSPLAALRLQVQSLARAPDDAARRVAGERVTAGIDRATRMVEQLLSLARQEAGQIQAATLQAVDMALLCQRSVDELQPLAQQAGLHLAFAADAAQPAITGQPDALALLLRNLLENALRYTPEGGQVQCSWGRAADEASSSSVAGRSSAVLTVEDSGPGIAAAERERVLDRFYRVPGTVAHGSGLGLAIVNAVARQHGARLALDDSPLLGGLRIRVFFDAISASGA
ncbi:ATP-binding protein [Comamonas odontotermitis]|nr:ATP-binding protein [Comamonas odontotermitis]